MGLGSILIPTFLCFAAASSALIRSRWERRQLRVEYYDIPWEEDQELKLAFLSDLHDYCRDFGIDGILNALKEASPDLVLLGGDMLTCQKHAGWTADPDPTLQLIERIAQDYTVIYAEGNHETRLRSRHPEVFESYKRRLEEAGVIYLINDRVLLDKIAIYGITLDEYYYRHLFPGFGKKIPMPQDQILKQLGLPEKGRYNILLLHSPLYLEEASSWGADLVLSGHFHGGTIRLPSKGSPGLMTPQYQFFVKECSGEHVSKNKKTRMIVSRGLGTHSINMRLNDLPEISLVRLKK